ncbi:MAG TPA: NAD(P)/FAD-dependent oxidoreductase, partial [Balneolales bacterium]|nr:NAD(P)/FAD-dependent oxidoreductase [Balneolales bacterium]
ILGKDRRIRVLLGEVERVDPERKSLTLFEGRTIRYDQLILAPGSHYNYFRHDEWEKYAPSLKSLGDALRVRERILLSLEEAEQIDDPKLREPYLTYVIIGGGPTGVEMAGAIAEIAKRNMTRDFRNISKNETRIFLVEAAPKILNGYPDTLSEKARAMLENMGVRVLLNTPVTDIREHAVRFKEGTIETPNIIWAAGVTASPLLNSLNAEHDPAGRVKVDPNLSIPVYPDIFVIGDAAHVEDEHGHPLPALAPVANQQGRFVGNLLKHKRTFTEGKTAFHYVDKGTMATIGRAKAIANVRGLKFSGFFAWLLWSIIHILTLISFRNRFRVFMEWVWYYFTFKRGVRLITDRSFYRRCKSPIKDNNEVLAI